jgi:hypothetical protein
MSLRFAVRKHRSKKTDENGKGLNLLQNVIRLAFFKYIKLS